jgi:hypothetical protein
MLQNTIASRVIPILNQLTLEDMKRCLPLLVDALAPFSTIDPVHVAKTWTDAEDLRELIVHSFRSLPDDRRATEALYASIKLIEAVAYIRVKQNVSAQTRAAV